MSDHFFFFVGLAIILTHEMDAIRLHEWEIFPLLSRLEGKLGYYVFTALHIPLYLAILGGLYDANGLNHSLIQGLDHQSQVKHISNLSRIDK